MWSFNQIQHRNLASGAFARELYNSRVGLKLGYTEQFLPVNKITVNSALLRLPHSEIQAFVLSTCKNSYEMYVAVVLGWRVTFARSVANRPRFGGGSMCVGQVGGEDLVLDKALDDRTGWVRRCGDRISLCL